MIAALAAAGLVVTADGELPRPPEPLRSDGAGQS